MDRRVIRGVVMLMSAVLLCGCEHKDLCYLHLHGAQVRINVDWSDFKEEEPTGMTLTLYPERAGVKNVQHISHTITHAVLSLEASRYRAMVYNQSQPEFGTLTFHDMDDWQRAEIRPMRKSPGWYVLGEGESLGVEPEWLACDTKETDEVTQEMVESWWEDDHLTKAEPTDEPVIERETVIATLEPENVIYTLHVRVRVDGIDKFRVGRAAITGMADGYRPGLGLYSERKVSHLMEQWSVANRSTRDGVTSGVLTSNITCFGLPYGHGASAGENTLHLTLGLVDNKTILNYSFDVGHLIEQREYLGSTKHLFLELELGERLPDVDDKEGDFDGFQVTVDDWGDEIDQLIPF